MVSPEAALGGLLLYVEDGDPIEIDTVRRTATLGVPEAVIAQRKARAPDFRPADERGWLSIYARTVQPMGQGAVLIPREDN